jgi:hypothetical protein
VCIDEDKTCVDEGKMRLRGPALQFPIVMRYALLWNLVGCGEKWVHVETKGVRTRKCSVSEADLKENTTTGMLGTLRVEW